jgi:hypothetical protein
VATVPRIRSIKPEFWSDQTIVSLDFFTRLLYIALWNFADDHGRNRAISKEISGFAFPLDDEVDNKMVESALQTLAEKGRIILYDANGLRHYQVVAWTKHQSVNRPTDSRIPPPEGFDTPSCSLHESLTEGAVSDSSTPHVKLCIGIRKQELGVRNQELGSRQQAVGTREPVKTENVENAAFALPPAALPCLPALPDVQARENAENTPLPALPPNASHIDYAQAFETLRQRGHSAERIGNAQRVLVERGQPITNWLRMLELKLSDLYPTGNERASPPEPPPKPEPTPYEIAEKERLTQDRLARGSLGAARGLELQRKRDEEAARHAQTNR